MQNKEEDNEIKITCITPSIRPDGAWAIWKTLQNQEMDRDLWEWNLKLSIPGPKPDLCQSMNSALNEANGELIVFVQDWMKLPENALQSLWELYKAHPNTAWTFPVGKIDDKDAILFNRPHNEPRWDWRAQGQEDTEIPAMQWEIDFGMAPKQIIMDAGMFDEEFDTTGEIGWENAELARRMKKKGCKFQVCREIRAVAWDHDKFVDNPYKGKSLNAKIFDKKTP